MRRFLSRLHWYEWIAVIVFFFACFTLPFFFLGSLVGTGIFFYVCYRLRDEREK